MKKFIALFFVLTLPLITPTAVLMGADTTVFQYPDGDMRIITTNATMQDQLHRGLSARNMEGPPTLSLLLQPCSSVSFDIPHPDIDKFTSLSRLAMMSHPTKEFYIASVELPIAPVVVLERVNFESAIESPELFAKEVSTDSSYNYRFDCSDVRCRAAMRAASNMNEVLAVLCRQKHAGTEDTYVDTYALLNSVVDDLIDAFEDNKDGLTALLGQIFLGYAKLNRGSLPTVDTSKTIMPTDMTLQYLDAWYLLTLHVTREGKLKDDEQVATKICIRLRNAVLGTPSSASSATMSDRTPSDDEGPASPEDVAPQLVTEDVPTALGTEEPVGSAAPPAEEATQHTQEDATASGEQTAAQDGGAEEPSRNTTSVPEDPTMTAPPKACCVVM